MNLIILLTFAQSFQLDDNDGSKTPRPPIPLSLNARETETLTYEEPKEYEINLTAGYYRVHCYGAKGGGASNTMYPNDDGGKGAYVSGEMKVKGLLTTFYGFVGGKGQSETESQRGGFNGGGNGNSKGSPRFISGGGGGATDLRIHNNLVQSRIIVAAGGSGAVFGIGVRGAPGGDFTGIYFDSDDYTNRQSKLTNQVEGGQDGVGGYGVNDMPGEVPGSGGGGGWRGGVSTGRCAGDDNEYNTVAHSGSSYISGYSKDGNTCIANPEMTFTNGQMTVGGNDNANGMLIIETIVKCPLNCVDCDESGVCFLCGGNNELKDNKCIECPDGSTSNGTTCIFPSNPFSNSNPFTKTNPFLKTNPFSKSMEFSMTDAFSQSKTLIIPTQTPLPTSEPSCILEKNDDSFVLDRCEYIEEKDATIHIRVIRTKFDDFVNESHGGAIYCINCGFDCKGANFTNCVSNNGGGGAIYIKNSLNLAFNITFEDNFFIQCRANYGGAVYIYCDSQVNEVSFNSCNFISNIALKKGENNAVGEFFGGSSIFITARIASFYQCIFKRNNQYAIKIYNEFDTNSNINALENEKSKNSILIYGCSFDKEDDVESSIYYINEKEESFIEINKCLFRGKLAKGESYINGKTKANDKNIVHIKECKFEYQENPKLNNDESMSHSKLKCFTILFFFVAMVSISSLILLYIQRYGIIGLEIKEKNPLESVESIN